MAETRRQIAEMDRAGIGGYFMHARGGLQTAYMGEEWMANIAAGIDEGRQRGMGAWAYDENGWPSGFGDGKGNGRQGDSRGGSNSPKRRRREQGRYVPARSLRQGARDPLLRGRPILDARRLTREWIRHTDRGAFSIGSH